MIEKQIYESMIASVIKLNMKRPPGIEKKTFYRCNKKFTSPCSKDQKSCGGSLMQRRLLHSQIESNIIPTYKTSNQSHQCSSYSLV